MRTQHKVHVLTAIAYTDLNSLRLTDNDRISRFNFDFSICVYKEITYLLYSKLIIGHVFFGNTFWFTGFWGEFGYCVWPTIKKIVVELSVRKTQSSCVDF